MLCDTYIKLKKQSLLEYHKYYYFILSQTEKPKLMQPNVLALKVSNKLKKKKNNKMSHIHQLKKKYTTIPNWSVMLFFFYGLLGGIVNI